MKQSQLTLDARFNKIKQSLQGEVKVLTGSDESIFKVCERKLIRCKSETDGIVRMKEE